METTLSDSPSAFTLSQLDVDDGVKLAVYAWPAPGGPPKAAIQISHGLAEHAGRYDRLARALTAAGYLVYASDHRGHGKTAAMRGARILRREGLAFARSSTTCTREPLHRGRHDGCRGLLRHSFGSFADQDFLFSHGDSVSAVALRQHEHIPVLPTAGLGSRTSSACESVAGTSKLLQTMSFGAYNQALRQTAPNSTGLSRDPARSTIRRRPPVRLRHHRPGWIDLFGELIRIANPEHQSASRSACRSTSSAHAGSVGGAGKGTFGSEAVRSGGLERVTSRLCRGTPRAVHRDQPDRCQSAELFRCAGLVSLSK